jgi:hypothetical protein
MKIKKLALGAFALGLISATLPLQSASAETYWQYSHGRRVEVNHRLANQHMRIDRDVEDGTMSPREARTLRTDDRAIRRQENVLAAHQGGHITPREQARINREENAVSRDITQ